MGEMFFPGSTHMKKIAAIILAVLVLGLFSCAKDDSTGKNLTILCEMMKPYNYEENGHLHGISIEVVQGILAKLELANPIEMSSDWDAIFKRLKTEDNIVAFTTGLTTERKEMFKWVGPITLWHVGFVGLEAANLPITTAEEAQSLTAVGVVKSYFTGEILRGLGFANLVEFADLDALVQGLYQGNVQAVFDNLSLLQIVAQDQGRDVSNLDNLVTYSTTQGYLAFSKNVSDLTISTWQEKLDEMKDDGTLQEMYDRYLPGTKAPGRVTIFTESNPPQNFIDQTGMLIGSSVDMVRAMMREIGVDYPLVSTNWTNAYAQIQLVPNAMTFSTLRTAAREALFHWVGPVCKKKYCFFVRADTDYQITTIDDARDLQAVGTVKGWSSEQQLIDLGFSNIVTFATPQIVLQKLLAGEIPCVVLNDISIRILLEELNRPLNEVRKEATLSDGQTFLAFSIDTDEEYIKKWTAAYNKIVSSGKLKQIWEEWYPDIAW